MATSDASRPKRPDTCLCRPRVPGPRTPEHPLGDLDKLYIDDSNCPVHGSITSILSNTQKFIRSIIDRAGPGSALPCGCDAVKGVLCERASRLRDQAEEYLSRPAVPENWQRYERLRVWLTRHFEEGKG